MKNQTAKILNAASPSSKPYDNYTMLQAGEFLNEWDEMAQNLFDGGHMIVPFYNPMVIWNFWKGNM